VDRPHAAPIVHRFWLRLRWVFSLLGDGLADALELLR